MEIIKLSDPVSILYFNVPDFPKGIEKKFTELMQMLPDMNGRTFYGISYLNEKGEIVYNCGVNEMIPDEANILGASKFHLPGGEYLSTHISNWMTKLDSIKTTFTEMMDNPITDKAFPCIEVYKSDRELQCLMKIA